MAGLDEYAALTITPNGQQALILHGTVLAYEHEHGERLAQFEYLKRDGAEQEPMGANASRLNYKLVLMGEAPLTAGGAPMSAGQRYQVLVTAQRSQPRCLLVDPRLGRWQVGWSSIRASEEPQKAIDCIEISLSFVEDQIDQALAIEAQPTPQARANQAVDAYSAMYAATFLLFGNRSNPSYQAVVNYAQNLAMTAAAFVNAALESTQNGTFDPTLRTMLASVESVRGDFFTTLARTTTDSLEPDVSLTEIRHAAYMTDAACVELLASIENLRPQVFDYYVASPMSLIQVLQLVYGSDAQSHREEAERLNPFFPTVTIPAGTTLRLVAPTPRQ